MAQVNEETTGALAREIGSRLLNRADLPPAASALPAAGRLPLGIAYHPARSAWSGIGLVAIGYYKDGEKRWRQIAIIARRRGAKEAFRAFRPGRVAGGRAACP